MPGIVQNHEFSASLTISERKPAHHWMDSVLASACRELESSWYFSSGTQDNTALGWWEPPHTSAELSCSVSGYAVQGTCVQRRKKITWSESQSLNDLSLLNIQKRKLKVSLHLSLNISFQSSILWRLWLFFSFCWAIYIKFFSPCSLISSKCIDKCASLRLSVLSYLSKPLAAFPKKKKKSAHWSWHQLWSSSEPNTQWNTKTSEVAHTLEYLESQFSTDCLLFSSSCPGDPIAFHRKLRFHWCT